MSATEEPDSPTMSSPIDLPEFPSELDNSSSPLEMADQLNLIICKTAMPSVVEFVESMSVDLMAMIAIAGSVTLATMVIYWRNYGEIKKRTPKEYFSRTVVLCGLYQIISVFSLLSMIVPKVFVLCDTLNHFTFLFGAYHLVNLFIEYVGGESNFIKHYPDPSFVLRTPPCCCCCLCFHPTVVTKNKFTFIRLLLAQFILVQGIVFVALNVIYIESAELYAQIFLYVVPVFVTSILLGVWGLNIVTRMLNPSFPDMNLRGKYLALQLVLMANKLQPIISTLIVANVDFHCTFPLTAALYRQEIVQLIIICQMFLLSGWALTLYKRPDKYECTARPHLLQQG